VVATTASGYTNVAGAPDCATSTTRCRWQKSHNNTRLEQREGCCPVLPPSAMTVLLQLLMAATNVGRPRQQQQGCCSMKEIWEKLQLCPSALFMVV